MTKQQIFNKIWNHFIVHKNPLSHVNHGMLCRFRKTMRASCKIRCFIGIFIPDVKYKKSLESGKVSFEDVVRLCPDFDQLFEDYGYENAIYFLDRLRFIHDESCVHMHYFNNVKNGLVSFANEMNIQIPPETGA